MRLRGRWGFDRQFWLRRYQPSLLFQAAFVGNPKYCSRCVWIDCMGSPASWRLHIFEKSNYHFFMGWFTSFTIFLSKGLSLSSSKRNHYGLHICMDPLTTWPVGLSKSLGVWCMARPAFHAGASGVVCGYLGLLTALVLRRRFQQERTDLFLPENEPISPEKNSGWNLEDDSFPFESWPLHAWYIYLPTFPLKNQASVDTYCHSHGSYG